MTETDAEKEKIPDIDDKAFSESIRTMDPQSLAAGLQYRAAA